MLAVIKTGGKQYKVSPKDRIKVEKLNAEEGKEVVFDNVLLIEENKKIEVGDPLIKGAKVTGKVLKQDRAKKITVMKYKPKTRERTKTGHRQPFTEIEIIKIES